MTPLGEVGVVQDKRTVLATPSNTIGAGTPSGTGGEQFTVIKGRKDVCTVHTIVSVYILHLNFKLVDSHST